jgi:hypothetical protein
MPGPISDSYDPVWGTASNASEVRDGIHEMDVVLTHMIKTLAHSEEAPRYILNEIRRKDHTKIQVELTERQMRILRYACRVALDEEDI